MPTVEVTYLGRTYDVTLRVDSGLSIWEQDTDGSHCYHVTFGKQSECTCPHFKMRLNKGQTCKHHLIGIVAMHLINEKQRTKGKKR